MFLDYLASTDASKRKGLRDSNGKAVKKYHYCFLIVTDSQFRGRGLASTIIERYKAKAYEDGWPMWLEATTSQSRDMYARIGFKIVEELRLGKGTHAENGAELTGGPGVPVWAMMWRPHNKGSGT
jgi:GNAT superfamily N-acetyltransferase